MKQLYCKPSASNFDKLKFYMVLLVSWIVVSAIISVKPITLFIIIIASAVIFLIDFLLSRLGQKHLNMTDINGLLEIDDPILTATINSFLKKNDGLTNLDLVAIQSALKKQIFMSDSQEEKKAMISSCDAIDPLIIKYLV